MKTLISFLTVLLIVCGCGRPKASTGAASSAAVAPRTNDERSPRNGERVWAQFSPDGTRVVTASGDGTARIWDARTGQPLTNLSVSLATPAGQRYQPDNPDNMPLGGPDNFQILQDQIDALERRVEALERKHESAGK